MTDFAPNALLPAGMSDVLAPDADFEAATLDRLMEMFCGYGYERVKPPLIEFEDSLLSGLGAAMTEQTFRLMDPDSQRMMGVRADMTPQIARIAASRLASRPRPLRLSYAGQSLRVSGSQLRPERQVAQAGAEIIGAEEPEADSEVIAVATDALTELGVSNLSVDLAMPSLIATLIADMDADDDQRLRLRQALDRKDAGSIAGMAAEIGKGNADLLETLLRAAGPADTTLGILKQLDLGGGTSEFDALATVCECVGRLAPDLALTIDPVESRGFEYHHGVTFTFFAKGVRGELGRGGRYRAPATEDGAVGEASTGFTLFMDTILRAVARPEPRAKVFLPLGTPREDGVRLRAEGWITVRGFATTKDIAAEARRLGCGHVFEDGVPRALPEIEKG